MIESHKEGKFSWEARLEELEAQLAEAKQAAEFNFEQYQDAGRMLCEESAKAEALRQQLAEAKFARRQAETDKSDVERTLVAANAEIERLKAVPMKYRRMEFNAQLQCENNELRRQLAAKDADIERLQHDNDIAFGSERYAKKQLVSAQLQITQLREALDFYSNANHIEYIYGKRDRKEDRKALEAKGFRREGEDFNGGETFVEWGTVAQQALAIPQDTTALEALIARAGEVMRERAIEESTNNTGNWAMTPGLIRAIPSVTLADLK